jgi:hypothetical protein
VSKNVRNILVVAFVGSLAGTVWGWGDSGHQIVGRIAEKKLSAQTQQAVRQILKPGEALADVAMWADWIKRATGRPFTGDLHYINVPDNAEEFDYERDCEQDRCVAGAITNFLGTLKDRDASAVDRYEALKFLVHFVGDIHQPLHVGRAGDKGGNDISVTFFDNHSRELDLHKVWDSHIIDRQSDDWESTADRLAAAITPEQGSEWGSVLDPKEWAAESLKLAVTNAYRFSPAEEADDIPALGASYYRRNLPVVERRLSMAGVRLAALLNQHLGGGLTPSTATFVGSRKSKVYHFPNCEAVERINRENLVTYNAAPTEKRLHKDCPW